MDMGRNLRNRPDGKSERSSLDASKTLKGYEYLMKHEYSVENVMRCARLSSIAYIHDKTSDLPGYVYIYILISRLYQMYEGRNRRSGYGCARFYAG